MNFKLKNTLFDTIKPTFDDGRFLKTTSFADLRIINYQTRKKIYLNQNQLSCQSGSLFIQPNAYQNLILQEKKQNHQFTIFQAKDSARSPNVKNQKKQIKRRDAKESLRNHTKNIIQKLHQKISKKKNSRLKLKREGESTEIAKLLKQVQRGIQSPRNQRIVARRTLIQITNTQNMFKKQRKTRDKGSIDVDVQEGKFYHQFLLEKAFRVKYCFDLKERMRSLSSIL